MDKAGLGDGANRALRRWGLWVGNVWVGRLGGGGRMDKAGFKARGQGGACNRWVLTRRGVGAKGG